MVVVMIYSSFIVPGSYILFGISESFHGYYILTLMHTLIYMYYVKAKS